MLPISTALNLCVSPFSSAIQEPHLPKASELTFSSEQELDYACSAFEERISTDIQKFILLSREQNCDAACQIWSDLLFSYFSLQLEMWRALGFSSHANVKEVLPTRVAHVKETLQNALSDPSVLHAWVRIAQSNEKLTPQQRLFAARILEENTHLLSKENIELLAQLKTLPFEAFARAQGMANPIDPQKLTTLRILTANIICFPGDLPYTYGGIRPWEMRMDALTEKLKSANAEILCLQEVWDPVAMRALMDRLKDEYAYFLYDAGDPAGTCQVDNIGYNSGLFIASKIPLDTATFRRFDRSIPAGSNRGALLVTCQVANEKLALINTHQQHGNTLEMRQVRKEHLEQCSTALQSAIAGTQNAWAILVGDLNIDGLSEEVDTSGLSREFKWIRSTDFTCTNRFNNWVTNPPASDHDAMHPDEQLDHMISLSKVPVERMLLPLFDLEHPLQALSDHHGLLTVWPITSSTEPKKKHL